MSRVQVIAPWRMPEFYNRFQGRNDLMEYAKVRPDSAITPALVHCPLQACPSRGSRLGLVPVPGDQTSALVPSPSTCSLGQPHRTNWSSPGLSISQVTPPPQPPATQREDTSAPPLPAQIGTSAVCVTQTGL